MQWVKWVKSIHIMDHVLPDTNAHGNGETPTPLYTVEFKAIELWGVSAENENGLVYLDLWEPYFNLNTE